VAVDLRRAFEGEETMTTETPPAWSLAMARSEMGFDIAAGSLAIDPIAAEGEETMTTETPPDWVLIEAARQSGYTLKHYTAEDLRLAWKWQSGSYRALCDMIQKYEKEPVDRKLLCARKASTFWYGPDALDGSYDSSAEVCCSIRAIELWEEGYE
jgi:hypothetical protein